MTRRRRTDDAPRPARRGFSLIEIMISMSLLAIVLSALAALSLRVSQRMRSNRIRTFRQAELVTQANRFSTMPYTELSSAAVDATITSGDFPHTRTVRRVNVAALTLDSIVITITPTNDATAKDSIAVVRVKPTYNPLAMP